MYGEEQMKKGDSGYDYINYNQLWMSHLRTPFF